MAQLASPARIRRDYDVQRRHLPRVLQCAAELRRFADLDEPAARRELDPKLAGLFELCWKAPYYEDLLIEQGYARFDVRGLEDLPGLPLLSRASLAAHWPRVLPVDASSDELCAVLSSGSTGEPLRAIKNGFDQVHMWACLRFWLERLGLPLPVSPRVCLLDALPGGLEYDAALPLLNDGELRRISLVRESPFERLAAFAPQVVFTDPAGLHAARGQSLPFVKLWLSSAQYLPAALRRSFAAPILNYYATTESGPIAWECLTALCCFHVMTPDVFVESVQGALLVTRLRNAAFPLLRYATGDAGEAGFGSCACGFKGWNITGFQGRRACWFVAPGGKRVDAWQLAWLFKHNALSEFRLTQAGESDFRLELAKRVETSALVKVMAEALEVLGWPEPRICVQSGVSLAPQPKPEPFRCEMT